MGVRNINEFSEEDRALAHLAIGYSSGSDRANFGDPVSDEELAILLEGKGNAVLGEVRYHQIWTQISNDQDLYQDWLFLAQEFRPECLTVTEPSASKARPAAQNPAQSFSDRLTDWLRPFFTPQVGLASAFSMALALVMAWSMMPASDPVPPSLLVMEEAEPLPEKAALAYEPRTGTGAIISGALVSAFKCQAIPALVDAELCYSDTPNQQHWFYSQSSTGLQALPPLVAASSILMTQLQADKLLVEYKAENGFNLALFRVNADNEGLEPVKIYQDQVSDGYFDGIALREDGLHYLINREMGSEAKHYSYDGDSH